MRIARPIIRTIQLVALTGLLGFSALPSSASSTTYTYIGNLFNEFGAPAACPTECRITGSFTVSEPLSSSFSGYFMPLSFNFTSGAFTLTEADATSSAFGFITNSVGVITAWNIDLRDASVAIFSGTGLSAVCPSGCTATDLRTFGAGFARVVDAPGTWSAAAAIPEPPTYAMMLAGLGAVLVAVRRRPAKLNP